MIMLTVILAVVIFGVGSFALFMLFGWLYEYFGSAIVAFLLIMFAFTISFGGLVVLSRRLGDWRESNRRRRERKRYARNIRRKLPD